MNTGNSISVKFKRMFVNILSIFVILAMAFPVTGGVSAATDSLFIGHWEAIDVDGSDIRLSIGGPASGPFQITWTESKDNSGLGLCEGGPGIVRGTGLLNENDPFALEADLLVECFTIEKSVELHLTFRYIPSTDTLATTYPGGLMVVFTHPRSPQASPAQVRLMTNYQEDWASGFYEEGHTVWLAVTESDGISVKATAEMVTGPQPGWDGGEIGFASQPWEWQPEQPDIVPNDWVYAWVDNGASAQMQVGEIRAWVDLENDQVLGTVSASWYSQEVYIYCFLWGMSDARDDMIIADGSEEFICSWSGGAYDIQPGDVAEVQYYGPDGHAVDFYLFIPNPRFTVFPEWEWFDGNDWPDAAVVDITVLNKTECTTQVESWGGFFNGPFGEGCDLVIGDTVTFTDGVTTRTHIVQNLAIASVDKQANTVSGTADAGATVYAWVHEYGYDMELQVGDGTWFADFGSAGLDLVENMGGRAEIRDEFGNGTAVDWYIPNPHFVIFPEWEWFDGNDWPDGAIVTITVQDKSVCATEGVSSGNFFNGGFPEGCDIAIGDVVTFTDGETIRTHTVRNLALTAVDEVANTVSGTSNPYETVYVWQHEPGEQIPVEVNEYGEWLADLNDYYDIRPGSSGRSEIRDEAGNSTAVDWYVPNPRIVASITEDWFYLVEFAPEATVNYSVYESDGVTPIWEDTATTDGSGFVWVDAEGRWDLEPGNYLVVSDGASEKDLVIEGFTFDVFDLTQGLLQGTAPGSEGRRVWTGIGFENDSWSMDVFTDADGNWLADFGAPVPGDYQWVAAQIFDSDGDASEVRPSDVVNWTLVIGNQPDWLSSGITVSAGQSFTVQALGLMNPCSDTYPNGDAICIFYTPVGAEWVVPYENQFGVFPGPGLNFMTLLGRIGDGEPFYVGAGGTFTAKESGPLWFTPNDNLRIDNQGAYSVLVLLEP